MKTKRQANKTIKQIIKNGNAEINIKGVTTYKRGGDDNEYGYHLKDLVVTDCGESIYDNETYCGKGMNIEKFGRDYMYLYTFDMVGNKTTAKIKYTDITIINK